MNPEFEKLQEFLSAFAQNNIGKDETFISIYTKGDQGSLNMTFDNFDVLVLSLYDSCKSSEILEEAIKKVAKKL